jgi:MFS family permease
MLLGVACLMAAQTVYLVANGFPAFVIAFLFLAAGGACFSGTEEALLFDSLKELGEEQTMTRHNSRYLSARNLPKIFIPAFGAFVAQGLLEWQLQTLILFDLVMACLAGMVLTRVVEPEHAMSVAAVERGIYRESLSTLREHRWLLAATINKVIPMTVALMIWRVYQPYLLNHGATIIGLGVLYIVLHSAMFSLRWLTEHLERRFGASHMLNLTVFSWWCVRLSPPSHPLLGCLHSCLPECS